MREEDFDAFSGFLSAIYESKRATLSKMTVVLWYKALEHYDYPAVEEALVRFIRNEGDNGQFLPQPADVIKLIDGSTQDAALFAWAKVDKAVKLVGPWADVVFDDQIIHRVVDDMGGWPGFGQKTDKEWPFVAKDFENRYRGYRIKPSLDAYLPILAGSYNTHNGESGHVRQEPVLIGDPRKAAAVMRGGSDMPLIGLHRAGATLMAALPQRPAMKLAGPEAANSTDVIDVQFTHEGKAA